MSKQNKTYCKVKFCRNWATSRGPDILKTTIALEKNARVCIECADLFDRDKPLNLTHKLKLVQNFRREQKKLDNYINKFINGLNLVRDQDDDSEIATDSSDDTSVSENSDSEKIEKASAISPKSARTCKSSKKT
jgi:hypothetical protein